MNYVLKMQVRERRGTREIDVEDGAAEPVGVGGAEELFSMR